MFNSKTYNAIRIYPEGSIHGEKWVYRLENKANGNEHTDWHEGGQSRDDAIARAERMLGHKAEQITEESGRAWV